MKTYKVKALSVGAPGNKIFKKGDTVKENNYPPGIADLLVSQGFLVVEGEEEAPEPLAKIITTEPNKTKEPAKQETELSGFEAIAKDLEPFTIDTPIDQVKEFLIKSGIPFSPTLSKIALVELSNKTKQDLADSAE